MAEYDPLEDEIKGFKRYRIANPIFVSLYALVTPFLATAGITNLVSEEGDSTQGLLCALFALYTAYKTFTGIKNQKNLNKTLARLQKEKIERDSLEKKVE